MGALGSGVEGPRTAAEGSAANLADGGDRRRPHERSDTRTNQRTGGRPGGLSTLAGDVELRIPKVKTGSLFPSLLESRRPWSAPCGQ